MSAGKQIIIRDDDAEYRNQYRVTASARTFQIG